MSSSETAGGPREGVGTLGDPATAPRTRLARLPDDGPLAPVVPRPVLIDAPIARHERIGPAYWRLTLEAPAIAAAARPGQFAMLTIPADDDLAPVLPRPMALYGWDVGAGTVDVVYRVVGEGTRRLTGRAAGGRMTTVGPLGRGFTLPAGARRVVLLGRGIGTCSLTSLGVDAGAAGLEVHALVSGRDRGALVGAETYRAAGARDVREVVDTDGSSSVAAVRAWLEAASAGGVDALYVCGSNRLLGLANEIGARHGAEVQVSLEAHMACGLGFCHGCATGHAGLAHESPLVCADGPVFRSLPVGPSAPDGDEPATAELEARPVGRETSPVGTGEPT